MAQLSFIRKTIMKKEIYFAAGCFWGAEHLFRQVDGVLDTEVGFANGHVENPTYQEVYTDATGHAETVRVTYEPLRVSLPFLLSLYFRSVDPTSLNRQGGDRGTRYRTGIYFVDDADRPFVDYALAQEALLHDSPLCVEALPLRVFYRAEEYHQDYLGKNPDGYCHLPEALFDMARRSSDDRTRQKSQQYGLLLKQISALAVDESDTLALMANMAALIHGTLGFWWTGFYRVKGGELLLGPFQGPPACMRIGYGKGVCGTAWERRATLLVPDVEAFPGHIACSADSRSEIVVPVFRGDEVAAVLDIDSQHHAAFDACDQYWLERCVGLLPRPE